MKFKLSAYTIYELGQRKRQEDSIFPQHNATQADDRLFIVCDGMGGHSGGNIASAAVCEAMSNKLLALCPDAEGSFSDDDLRQALEAAYDSLDAKDDGSEKKMGTTMTLLKFHNAGCTIAHIGDSRVYHVRPGADSASTEILFQTQDHSLVNDLVRIGELTPEEAKTSKQRNIITRAMQPNMGRRSRADIYHTTDIRPGDYFMLCTDGILEQMEDDNIKYIFSDKVGDAQQKVDMIVKVTEDNSDNHSAILVKVTDVKGAPVVAAADVDLHQTAESVEEKHESKSKRTQLIYLSGMLAIVVGTIIFLLLWTTDDIEEFDYDFDDDHYSEYIDKATSRGVERLTDEEFDYDFGDDHYSEYIDRATSRGVERLTDEEFDNDDNDDNDEYDEYDEDFDFDSYLKDADLYYSSYITDSIDERYVKEYLLSIYESAYGPLENNDPYSYKMTVLKVRYNLLMQIYDRILYDKGEIVEAGKSLLKEFESEDKINSVAQIIIEKTKENGIDVELDDAKKYAKEIVESAKSDIHYLIDIYSKY